MRRMSLVEAEKAAEASIISKKLDKSFTKVVINSKEASEDCLFIGLIGEKSDGSQYAPQAYEKGCRAFLLSQSDFSINFSKDYRDAEVMVVENTLIAMQKLAKYYLGTCKAKCVGITGSVGKTTTKEMCYKVLSNKFKTICNYENYNNHIGVPLTAFLVEEDTEVAIFEMGMNHRGEILPLADIVHPKVAIITTVGVSHLGNLGSRDEIFHEKMDIAAFLPEDGKLIYNSDNDKLSSISYMDTTWGKFPCGENVENFGIKISDIKETDSGTISKLEYKGENALLKLPLMGKHNVGNAALSVALGLSFGISLIDCIKALKDFQNKGSRLKIIKTNSLMIIDDTYNANPESVEAALDVLSNMKGGRKVVALADMLELGENSIKMHTQILESAIKKKIDLIIAVGDLMREGTKALDIKKNNIILLKDKDILIKNADNIFKDGDIVLFKGSHSMKMNKVAEYLVRREELDV